MNNCKVPEKLLNNLIANIISDHRVLVSSIFEEVLAKVGFAMETTDFFRPIKKVESIFLKKTSHLPAKEQNIVRRSLVAKIGLHLWSFLDKLNLPSSIMNLYPQSFIQLENHLKGNALCEYSPADDYYCKDLRFVLGLSVPCGAQVVDLATRLRPYSILLSIVRSGQLHPAYLYARARGYSRWLGIHTDTRNLTDFNERGWDDCYMRIAELLERRKTVRGLVGTSWFFDPQLLKISPHLSYLQQRPLERGAFLLKHCTRKIDVERATLTSRTRARLFEEGRYVPVSYSIVWPRNALIAWSKNRIY